MMETILNHRSIRKYKDKAVSKELLDEVLTAGVRASNTGNMQVYSVVVTQEQERKEKLWEFHFKQNMVKEAPVVLTFCADINRFNKWCEYRDAEPGYDNFLWFYTASIDAIIAAQNVCLAAEERGLGICYLGTTNYMAPQIIEALELAKGVIPVTTVVLGYPDETPELVDRLPLEAVVHYETYKEFNKEEIDKIYSEKEALQETLDLIEENQTENLAQIFTDKRYIKKNNVHFSKVLLDVLKDQGFMNHE